MIERTNRVGTSQRGFGSKPEVAVHAYTRALRTSKRTWGRHVSSCSEGPKHPDTRRYWPREAFVIRSYLHRAITPQDECPTQRLDAPCVCVSEFFLFNDLVPRVTVR